MSRSIADVYVCRKDWYDANREWVNKFVAGHMKFERSWSPTCAGPSTKKERAGNIIKLLGMAQSIYGKEVLPTLEVDAHGLLLDCTFVGLPGNRAFFEDKGNLAGFEAKQKQALDLAVNLGYAKQRVGFIKPGLNYDSLVANWAGSRS